VIELVLLGAQARFDVAQTLAIRQLSERKDTDWDKRRFLTLWCPP